MDDNDLKELKILLINRSLENANTGGFYELQILKRVIKETSLADDTKVGYMDQAKTFMLGLILPLFSIGLYNEFMRWLFVDQKTIYIPVIPLLLYWTLFFFVQPGSFSPNTSITIGELKKNLEKLELE
jgi:hypothetical protein